MEAKLNPNKFVRVHRSTIVNIDRIKEMHPLFNGDQMIIMQSGKKLTMTRNYRDKLKTLLGNF
ncbi:MAG: LytTR family transcriptional regulator [Blastocatellia bacterium]|nr:LytTR family transcriptional regulator [Blastocatellia bacterium]